MEVVFSTDFKEEVRGLEFDVMNAESVNGIEFCPGVSVNCKQNTGRNFIIRVGGSAPGRRWKIDYGSKRSGPTHFPGIAPPGARYLF